MWKWWWVMKCLACIHVTANKPNTLIPETTLELRKSIADAVIQQQWHYCLADAALTLVSCWLSQQLIPHISFFQSRLQQCGSDRGWILNVLLQYILQFLIVLHLTIKLYLEHSMHSWQFSYSRQTLKDVKPFFRHAFIYIIIVWI